STASTAPSAAASAAAASAAAPSAAAAATPLPEESLVIVTPEPVAAVGPNGGQVVRWFIGLGAGTQPQHLKPEADWVKKFNDSQKDVYLVTEIVDNSIAAASLKTAIAGGNAPDIIGPVGIEGLNQFRDQLQ